MRPVENGSCVYVYVCVGMKINVCCFDPAFAPHTFNRGTIHTTLQGVFPPVGDDPLAGDKGLSSLDAL